MPYANGRTTPSPEPNYGTGAARIWKQTEHGWDYRQVGAFDRESHLMCRGLTFPRMVCAAYSGIGKVPEWVREMRQASPQHVIYTCEKDPYLGELVWSALFGSSCQKEAEERFEEWAEVIVAHNAAFDAGMGCAHWGQEAVHRWFERFAQGTVIDTQVRETLLAIATDNYQYDKRISKPKPLYTLADLVRIHFDVRLDENKEKIKTNEVPDYADKISTLPEMHPWRLRFCQLDHVPVAQWPRSAIDYAFEDTLWPLRVAFVQANPQNPRWADDGTQYTFEDGGVRNEIPQARASFTLALVSAWGPQVDPEAVELFAQDVEAVGLIRDRFARGDVEGAKAAVLKLPEEQRKPFEYLMTLTAMPTFKRSDSEALMRNLKVNEKDPKKTERPDDVIGPWVRTALNKRTGLPTQQDGTGDAKALQARLCYAFEQLAKAEAADEGRPEAWWDIFWRKIELTDGGIKRAAEGEPWHYTDIKAGAEYLSDCDDPVLKIEAECAEAIKLRDTYLPILRSAVGRPLTSSPRYLIATGRTAWSNPNLQNPPRSGRFRECFVPRAGNVFMSCDYTQIELCALAQIWLWLFGTSSMADAINNDDDLHVLFGINYEPLEQALDAMGLARQDIRGRYLRAIQGKKDSGDVLAKLVKKARQWAKAGNFGRGGGMGGNAMCKFAKSSYNLILDIANAKDMLQRWDRAWAPESYMWFDLAADATAGGSRVTVRQLVSWRIRGGCGYSDSLNTRFQGLPADGIKEALWHIMVLAYCHPDSKTSQDVQNLLGVTYEEACSVYGYVRVWDMIHDEILYEGPEATCHLWAEVCSKVQVVTMRRYMPDVLIKAAPAVSRRWLKDAEPVYNAAGELVPWEPEQKAA